MARHPPLDERFTGYATIALATVAIEHALEASGPPSDVHARIASLVADLWAWQDSDQVSDHKRMSEDEARTLPAFGFYGRLADFRALRDQRAADPRIYALLSGVCSLLEIIVWVMDGIERDLNWGKPTVVGNEIGDDAWVPLHDGLEALTRAAHSPDDEFAWQERIIEAFATTYPGGASEEHEAESGSPVTRDDAHRL
jgi:hypothetical protein